MATRGWENATENDVRGRQVPVKPSKYRNVKTVVGTETFDSRAEADYWVGLQARAARGEIQRLTRQSKFALLAPTVDRNAFQIVSYYVADFVYWEEKQMHVVDKKGKRTQGYLLKKKWLELQENIRIEEV